MYSSSSSSTSSTRTGASSAMHGVLPGKLDQLEPVAGHGADQLHQRLESDRLGDERIGPRIVSLEDVLLLPRGGEDHHRDRPQRRVVLDLAQRLAPVLSR